MDEYLIPVENADFGQREANCGEDQVEEVPHGEKHEKKVENALHSLIEQQVHRHGVRHHAHHAYGQADGTVNHVSGTKILTL